MKPYAANSAEGSEFADCGTSIPHPSWETFSGIYHFIVSILKYAFDGLRVAHWRFHLSCQFVVLAWGCLNEHYCLLCNRGIQYYQQLIIRGCSSQFFPWHADIHNFLWFIFWVFLVNLCCCRFGWVSPTRLIDILDLFGFPCHKKMLRASLEQLL